jgi:Questin oxidase-like
MMLEKELPVELDDLVRRHGASFAPHYPPSDNSDHGPMAFLAMHGLGIGFDDIAAFALAYQSRLVSAPPPKIPVGASTWRDHIGRRESYSALLAFFENEIAAAGWQVTLSRYLPSLMSGWVKDAFHPLIRLGYGIEFESTSEIAAGLAYMTITGDDRTLADIAKRSAIDLGGRAYLESMRSIHDPRFSRGPFNVRYQRIISGAAELRPAAGDTHRVLEEICRACLEVFQATHEFFALHLVTSSHAFRVCAPWAGRDLASLFSVGITTAYLAIGAPQFDPLPGAAAALPTDRLRKATDEHDIKVAYSCLAQSRAFSDPTYEWVAAEYLKSRLPVLP